MVGYTPDYWIIQNSWGKLSHYNGYVRLAMGNTLNVCSYGQYPVSTKSYNVQPSTDVINFENDFGPNGGYSGSSGSTSGTSGSTSGTSGSSAAPVEGINLNYLIGTKFYIFSETYYASQTNKNNKGEQFTYLSYSYWY